MTQIFSGIRYIVIRELLSPREEKFTRNTIQSTALCLGIMSHCSQEREAEICMQHSRLLELEAEPTLQPVVCATVQDLNSEEPHSWFNLLLVSILTFLMLSSLILCFVIEVQLKIQYACKHMRYSAVPCCLIDTQLL